MGFPRYDAELNGMVRTTARRLLLQDGRRFTTHYSTADLGAQTTPDDMIQLHFLTPPISIVGYIHMEMIIVAANAAVFKLIEAPTGGLESPEGTLIQPNLNRVLCSECEPPVPNMYYNATAATGGLVLKETHIGQPGHPGTYSSSKLLEEWLLKPSTTYALSVHLADTIAASITLFGNIY